MGLTDWVYTGGGSSFWVTRKGGPKSLLSNENY